jgi:hypothetical protein
MGRKYPHSLLIILVVLALIVAIYARPPYTAAISDTTQQVSPSIDEILNRRMPYKTQQGLMVAGITAASTLGVVILLFCYWCRSGTSCGSYGG